MTKAVNDFITKLCKAEGGKRQALDAGQAREVLAKMREIIGTEIYIDLYEILDFDSGKFGVFDNNTFVAFKHYPAQSFKKKG